MRPAARLFYAQQKAELEHLLLAESAGSPGLALYLLRPSIVLGPHTVGAKNLLPGVLAPLARQLSRGVGRVPVPVLVPALRVQFVHEDDVGRALLQCVVGAGPPGPYNIAADDIVSAADIAREFGLLPLSFPAGPVQAAARVIAGLPFLPPGGGVGGGSQPPSDHGHDPGQAGAGLEAALHRARGAAGHPAPRRGPGPARRWPALGHCWPGRATAGQGGPPLATAGRPMDTD